MDEEALVERTVRHTRVAAILGVKGDDAKNVPAHTIPALMQKRGIRIVPVNPTITSALGVPSLKSVADLRERVDVLVVFRRSEAISAHADEILAMSPDTRPPVVWMQTGIVNEEAARKLRGAGVEVVMDRCFGVEMSRLGRTPAASHKARLPGSS